MTSYSYLISGHCGVNSPGVRIWLGKEGQGRAGLCLHNRCNGLYITNLWSYIGCISNLLLLTQVIFNLMWDYM